MTIRNLGEWLTGTVIPTVVDRGREVFTVDGVAYRIRLAWLGRAVGFEYQTPRYPRDVRRIRAAERRHLDEFERRIQAGEPFVQVGDVIPAHRIIPVDVVEVRNCDGEVWRRAVGEERFSPSDDDLPVGLRQPYDWVHEAYTGEIAGHATDRGVLDYAPLTVTEVAQHA